MIVFWITYCKKLKKMKFFKKLIPSAIVGESDILKSQGKFFFYPSITNCHKYEEAQNFSTCK